MAITVENVKESFSRQETRTIKCMVAGPPGSGKTRSASTWPNVLYADAEGRLLSIRDRDVRRVEIASTQDLDELKSILDQKPDVRAQMLNGPVETVVIDTVDEIARLVIKERLRAEKKEAMAIADWGYLGDTLRALLRGYRNLAGVNVIFNVHLKSDEDSETGRVSYKPAIQGAVGDQIAEFVDECFLLVARPMTDPRTGDRVISRHLQTYPDAQHNWVKDHSGTLPQEFPINFDDDYARLAALIFGDAAPPPAARSVVVEETKRTPPPASPSPAKKPPKRGRQPLEPTITVNLPAEDVAPTTPEPDKLVATPDVDAQVAQATEPAADEPPASDEVRVVPEKGTPAPVGDPLDELGRLFPCAVCGNAVEDRNYQDLSMIRYGKPLCRVHFVERSKR